MVVVLGAWNVDFVGVVGGVLVKTITPRFIEEIGKIEMWLASLSIHFG